MVNNWSVPSFLNLVCILIFFRFSTFCRRKNHCILFISSPEVEKYFNVIFSLFLTMGFLNWRLFNAGLTGLYCLNGTGTATSPGLVPWPRSSGLVRLGILIKKDSQRLHNSSEDSNHLKHYSQSFPTPYPTPSTLKVLVHGDLGITPSQGLLHD